jgi:hypothetical protein
MCGAAPVFDSTAPSQEGSYDGDFQSLFPEDPGDFFRIPVQLAVLPVIHLRDMTPHDLHEEFMRLFITAEPKLRAYAFACGLSREQADDLVQEEALVLWRRYDTYDRTRPFLPWALGIAHHLIQKDRQVSHAIHLLSPDVAQQLAETCSRM